MAFNRERFIQVSTLAIDINLFSSEILLYRIVLYSC